MQEVKEYVEKEDVLDMVRAYIEERGGESGLYREVLMDLLKEFELFPTLKLQRYGYGEIREPKPKPKQEEKESLLDLLLPGLMVSLALFGGPLLVWILSR